MKKLRQISYQLSLIYLLLAASTSCYRMPTDDDCCVIPNLNNPDITREQGSSNLMPSVSY